MELDGKKFKKEELLRKVGSMEQICGVRSVEYSAGDANLVKAHEVDTGGGLTFSVNENKCLDIFRMSYRGINLGFISKAGLHSPYNADQRNTSFLYSQGCGMLYTAGLANVGGGCTDAGDEQYGHGRIKNISARNLSIRSGWRGDEYQIELSGEMHESAFFGRNLILNRKIKTMAGSRCIHIEDMIENQDFKSDEIMLLYHLNAGYPLLDEGAEYCTAQREIEAMSECSAQHLDAYHKITAPEDHVEEDLFCIYPACDREGYSAACLTNPRLEMGLYIKYDTASLPYMIEWKCMKSGDYAFGMLAANCKPIGRIAAKEQGGLKELKPFETCAMRMEIGVLDGKEEIAQFKEYIGAMK